MIRILAAAATLILATGAAAAGTSLTFPEFTGINVHSGAKVVLHHGAVQRVTVIKGDPGKADLHMTGNTLDISPCRYWFLCWHAETLEVDIVSPRIDNLEAHGGGSVSAAGDFPKQPSLDVEAHGGGSINARAIPADAVNASAHGGGSIHANALVSIRAEAHGGGSISYAGNPPHVTAKTHGGGAIGRE
jgi:hypothetical protein